MAQTAARIDPYVNFNFLVELDGVSQASFRECTGLDATTEVIETREGGDNVTVRKLPGKTTYTNITLRWGLTDSEELWAWRQQVIDGQIQRKSGSIVIYDLQNRREVVRWNFINAWPTVWKGPDLNASGNEVAVETLEIAHEGIKRVKRT